MKRKKRLRELFELQRGKCAYCEKDMDITRTNTPDAPSLDHVIPKSSGGTNDAFNLVCACVDCNSRKGSLPLIVFIANRRRLC